MAELSRCERCGRRIPWFSFSGNLSLAIYKLIIGLLGRSAALIADAVHSFADVLGSATIVVVTRVARKRPDDRFPYGRGKAEFLGAIYVYTVLTFLAIAIIVGAIKAMASGRTTPPLFVTVLGALVSVMYNYLMYKYCACVGKRLNSPAIMADAFENRADAISSAACIGGIIAAIVIHPICDAIAALAVGCIILYNCQEQLRGAARGLMDSGLEEEEVEQLRQRALAHPEVVGVRFLRSRENGARFWVDLGIEVTHDTSVEQSDEIAEWVRQQIQSDPRCYHAQVYVMPSTPQGPEQPPVHPLAFDQPR